MSKISFKLIEASLISIRAWRVWWYLGVQDIKTRFKRSFFGPLWILVNMSLFVGGAGLVYGLIFSQAMDIFLPFLTAGFVIWGFIVSSITESSYAFINAEGYIKQFSYPKQIYLFRAVVSISIVFCLSLVPLFFMQIYFGKFYLNNIYTAIPGLFILLLTGLSHTTIAAYITTRFRDIPHALAGALQVLFFMTPILFPVDILKQKGLDFIYQFNPLFYLIDIVRFPLLNGMMADAESYIVALFYMCLTWVIAFITAKKLDSKVVFLL